MGKRNESDQASRRDFLKLATVSAPAVAAAAAMTVTAAEAVEIEDAGEGLRDTAHTKAYYESAKF